MKRDGEGGKRGGEGLRGGGSERERDERERERERGVGGERADISLVKRKETFPYEYNLILSSFRDTRNLWTR